MEAAGLKNSLLVGALLCSVQACDLANDARVQPLPPLSRPSPAARAGLPEISGEWRFAGWDLPTADTATALSGLPAPGALLIETQRADSLAGFYVMGPERHRLVGEVRRDSIVALVAYTPAGEGRFLAGRVRGDTLWMELTSLAIADPWPPGTRAAFMRGGTGSPFARLPGGIVLRTEPEPAVAPDTAAASPPTAPGAAVPAPARTPITGPADTAARRTAPPPAPATRPRPAPRPDTAAEEPVPPDTADAPPPDTSSVSPRGAEPAAGANLRRSTRRERAQDLLVSLTLQRRPKASPGPAR